MNLIRVDSSMVAETCNKLKKGFTVGKKPGGGKTSRKQIKYTMAYDGFSAKLTEVFSDSTYLSEDMAMPEVLTQLIKKDSNNVTEQRGKFVGRIKTNRKMEVVRSLMDETTDTDLRNLDLQDDIVVHLYDGKKKEFSKTEYRVIKARFKVPRDTTRPANKGKVKRVEDEVYLITNDFELTAKQIAEAYKKRWDIEVFFKFLKQNLSFSHFISTSENGIKVVLYMTLITAMLVLIYKRENEMGYTIGKFSFFMEMQDWVVKLMATLQNEKLNLLAYENMRLRARIP